MSALLEIEDLEVVFGGRSAAVRGASLRVEKGETHCLVGESGCGKSVTALAVMVLLARGAGRSQTRAAQRYRVLGRADRHLRCLHRCGFPSQRAPGAAAIDGLVGGPGRDRRAAALVGTHCGANRGRHLCRDAALGTTAGAAP